MADKSNGAIFTAFTHKGVNKKNEDYMLITLKPDQVEDLLDDLETQLKQASEDGVCIAINTAERTSKKTNKKFLSSYMFVFKSEPYEGKKDDNNGRGGRGGYSSNGGGRKDENDSVRRNRRRLADQVD